jgi:FAD-dependent oxidoreductase family protein
VELECDVLVVGAGCGGLAAALTAARTGCSVVLTEPTRWVGGQLTSQAVPADEHPWIESTGSTGGYRQMREAVRQRYRDTLPLTEQARSDPHLNPGRAWVSAIAAEPVVIQDVLRELLRDQEARGRLHLLLCTVPVSADVDGDRVEAVSFTGPDGDVTITAGYVLDATEEGDLLPLTGCEHVVGAESVADTGEPHALDGPADPFDQQAVTWCFALERVPGRADIVDRPATYAFWRDYQATHWPGPQLGWATTEPETGRPLRRPLFGPTGEQDLWTFRRIRHGASWVPAVPDVTLVNWPQVDYWLAPMTGVDAEQRARARAGARELSLAFVHWLQTEAPRPDGGTGYPDVALRGDVLGTDDGFAMEPYVREARRIRAVSTVLEQHVGVEARPGADGAERFVDSVGVGSYRIDLHPSTSGRGYLDIATYPFEIPLGALVPQRMQNLLAAGKSIGTTHVTNGCYRLHPVEWGAGEAAGALAAWCLQHGVRPVSVREQPHLEEFQRCLQARGVQLHWPQDLRGRQR